MVLEHVAKQEEGFRGFENLKNGNATVGVVGLGYVGFPLAVAFSEKGKVIGFDVSERRLAALKGNESDSLVLTSDPRSIARADFILICVPTPVTKTKEPDMSFITSAAQVVGQHMSSGATVVLESTVYPGVTEDIMVPILEKESGLNCGRDFKVGYSPERINPGDGDHSLGRIRKIVAGMDEETTDALMALYGQVTTPYRAPDIKTAEAAKVIENIQRDLNIALVNELSIIFQKLGLDTKEVLNAASTKWNFIRFEPGMVGGHCIPVDPYYLVYKAKELGYHSQVIMAGRSINDHMPKHVAEMMVKGLNEAKKVISDSNVLIMGLTYKANVPDTRESPAKELVRELKEYDIKVFGRDPLLSKDELESFSVHPLGPTSPPMDGIIVAVPHQDFGAELHRLDNLVGQRPVLLDVKGIYDGTEAKRRGYIYKRL